jgi:uncharacterized membrane protein
LRIRNRYILIFSIVFSIVLVPLFYWTSGIPRIFSALLFILFIPGYSLMSTLFPKHDDMIVSSRIALSFGTSIALVAIIGLLLHFIPSIGLNYISILFSVLISILVFSFAAIIRDYRLPTYKRISFKLNINLPRWQGLIGVDKGLYIVSSLAILVFIITFSYVVLSPPSGEKYSEFYVLDSQGKTDDYTHQINLGESSSMIIGIVNHEEEKTNYRIEIDIGRQKISEIQTGKLNDGEKWEKLIEVVPQQSGNSQKIELWLFKNNEEDKTYNKNSLHLFIDVLP